MQRMKKTKDDSKWLAFSAAERLARQLGLLTHAPQNSTRRANAGHSHVGSSPMQQPVAELLCSCRSCDSLQTEGR